ncbi:MAG: FHA domain-containing protein [Vicinamibacterales bacterium]
MTRKPGRWIGTVTRIESAIAAKVETATRTLTGSTGRQPLETLHAVVDLIERDLRPTAGGRGVLPFTQIRIRLVAPSHSDRVRLQLLCDGPPALDQRVRERLAEAGAPGADLPVKTSFVTRPGDRWPQRDFHVDYVRSSVPAAAPAPVPRLELRVAHGSAERPRCTSTGTTVAIGRGTEVRDSRHRLIRTNHIAFIDDGSDLALSVSRRHARIEPEAKTGRYRLHDESSGQATTLVRNGRGLPVPRGRGILLQDGDLIVVGQAQIEAKLR